MDSIKQPDSLCLEGNVSENWRKWKQRFHLYMTASGMADKPMYVRSCTLLHTIGEEALEIYNTFDFDNEDDKKKLDVLLTKFTEYFEPQKNVTYERHKFNTRTQMQGEHFDIFVTDLKKKAQTCEFGNLGDSLIKDRIVVGIIEDSTRARLLREKNLTLQRAIEICRAAEISKSQIGDMAAGVQSTITVNALYKQKSKGKRVCPQMRRLVSQPLTTLIQKGDLANTVVGNMKEVSAQRTVRHVEIVGNKTTLKKSACRVQRMLNQHFEGMTHEHKRCMELMSILIPMMMSSL